MYTEELKVEKVYKDQERYMYAVINKMKPLIETATSPLDQDELISIMNLAFVQAYNRFDETKGVKFLTYVSSAYENTILREVNRSKHGLTHPITASELVPSMINLLNQQPDSVKKAALEDEESFLRFAKKNSKSRVVGSLYGVLMSVMTRNSTSIEVEIQDKDGSASIRKSVLKHTDSLEYYDVNRVLTDYSASELADYKRLPKLYMYWMIQVIKGYTIDEISAKLTIHSKSFYYRKVRDVIVKLLTTDPYEECLLYDALTKKAEDDLRKAKKAGNYEDIVKHIEEVVEKDAGLLI